MPRLIALVLLGLALVAPVPIAAAEVAPCGTHAWRYDGGKSIPFENELRVQASDGCHTYELVGTVARDALNGVDSGSGTIVIGPTNQPWEAGSTVPDPGSVGYCRYAAAQSVHGVMKYHFGLPEGAEISYRFDCTHPAT